MANLSTLIGSGYTRGVGPAGEIEIDPTVIINPNTSPSVTDKTPGSPDLATIEFSLPRAANVSIGTVSTLTSGANATVTNSGSNGDVVLNFGIPEGTSSVTSTSTTTFSNKTIDLSNNTISGTLAQFNTALSDGAFVSAAGIQSLTNKTINLTDNTLSGTLEQFNAALSDGSFSTSSTTEILTNKSINLSNNTLSGNTAQFNSALSDDSFAMASQLSSYTTLSGSETLTNKTIHGNTNTLTVDGTNEVGFRNIPINGNKTSSYTLTTGDVGKAVTLGSGGSINVPNSTFSAGDIISIYNSTTADITITCSISTAYIGGTNENKETVSLSTRGIATIFFISSTVCVITGNIS